MKKQLLLFILFLVAFIANAQTFPIKIDAIRYDAMLGVAVEESLEGGMHVTNVNAGDYIDFKINIQTDAVYFFKVRTAGHGGMHGGILQIRDSANRILGTIKTPPTQNKQAFAIGAGRIRMLPGYRTYRIYAITEILNFKSIEIDTSNYRHYMTFTPLVAGNSTWENTHDVNGWIKEINNARPAAATIVENPFGKPGWAMKFEQRKTDTPAAVRAEMRLTSLSNEPREGWWSWSEYLPSEDWAASDPHQDVSGQWHERPDFHLGETWRSPPIMKKIQNGKYWVNIIWASAAVNSNPFSYDGQATIDCGPVLTDQWVDWVFHIKYAYDNTGILEVWKNGVKVVERINMPNSFNDVDVPYFKIGVYKGAWCCAEYHATSPGTKRTIYIRNVKIGKPNSFYNEMKQ
jgi:hypothetical protein